MIEMLSKSLAAKHCLPPHPSCAPSLHAVDSLSFSPCMRRNSLEPGCKTGSNHGMASPLAPQTLQSSLCGSGNAPGRWSWAPETARAAVGRLPCPALVNCQRGSLQTLALAEHRPGDLARTSAQYPYVRSGGATAWHVLLLSITSVP